MAGHAARPNVSALLANLRNPLHLSYILLDACAIYTIHPVNHTYTYTLTDTCRDSPPLQVQVTLDAGPNLVQLTCINIVGPAGFIITLRDNIRGNPVLARSDKSWRWLESPIPSPPLPPAPRPPPRPRSPPSPTVKCEEGMFRAGQCSAWCYNLMVLLFYSCMEL